MPGRDVKQRRTADAPAASSSNDVEAQLAYEEVLADSLAALLVAEFRRRQQTTATGADIGNGHEEPKCSQVNERQC